MLVTVEDIEGVFPENPCKLQCKVNSVAGDNDREQLTNELVSPQTMDGWVLGVDLTVSS